MIGWLTDAYRRWRRNKSRAVFRFFDGRRTRAVDPYVVYRFLDQHAAFKWEHLEMTDEGDAEAADTTITAAREAFGLAEFDGTTATLAASEVLDILTRFGEWLSAAKKKLGPTSISSSPTVGESSSASDRHDSIGSFSSASI